ncbi:MAG: heavy-metal-associated domain-containing protein [Sphingobacteriaceae bacterium]|nr:heavy-metal-associated domain-containing protein [Cytophagaceae bacterium]
MQTRHFKTNIKCGGCVATVTPHLAQLHGVTWNVDLQSPDRILTAEGPPAELDQVPRALLKAGYQAEPQD